MTNPKAYCYRFRFDDGEVFYIGNTTNPTQRIKYHRHNLWIAEPFTVDLMEVPFKMRYKIETALIRKYRPSENSFVAKHDNEFRDIPEKWIPWVRISPDENRHFGAVKQMITISENNND